MKNTMKNAVKDIQRGQGTRLADGAALLQEGNDPADFAHVSKATPLQLKMKELQNDPRYVTEAAPDTNKAREKSTSRKRWDKETKPL